MANNKAKINLSLSDLMKRKYPLACDFANSTYGKKSDLFLHTLDVLLGCSLQDLGFSPSVIADENSFDEIIGRINSLLKLFTVNTTSVKPIEPLSAMFTFSCRRNGIDALDQDFIAYISHYLLTPENIKEMYEQYSSNTVVKDKTKTDEVSSTSVTEKKSEEEKEKPKAAKPKLNSDFDAFSDISMNDETITSSSIETESEEYDPEAEQMKWLAGCV